METLKLEKLCSWVKHRLTFGKTRSYTVNSTCNESKLEGKCDETSEEPSKLGQGSKGRKRKIAWDILHPIKARRLEREDTQPLQKVEGSFTPDHVDGAMFPGHQSTAISMCAILRAQTTALSTWTPDVIDTVMLQGDRLHTVRVCHLGEFHSEDNGLTPEELPPQIALNKIEYTLIITERKIKDALNSSSNYSNCYRSSDRLCPVIEGCLRGGESVILTTDAGTTLAIMGDGVHVYLFHPNKKSSSVTKYQKTVPELSQFRDSKHACKQLFKRHCTWVCLWGVELDVDCHTWAYTQPHNPWV